MMCDPGPTDPEGASLHRPQRAGTGIYFQDLRTSSRINVGESGLHEDATIATREITNMPAGK